jgi:hypothetical protein
VRDALGSDREDPYAIESGLQTAIEKMWRALDESGFMFSVHQTQDLSDGSPSQMLPVSRKYCGALDDIPERIATRSEQLGGYIATVNFTSPLVFPELRDAGWEALKRAGNWNRLDPMQLRTLQLLNFIAYDFSEPGRAAVEKLGADKARRLCRRVPVHRDEQWRTYHRKMCFSTTQQISRDRYVLAPHLARVARRHA